MLKKKSSKENEDGDDQASSAKQQIQTLVGELDKKKFLSLFYPF